jgi:hypothetical protein
MITKTVSNELGTQLVLSPETAWDVKTIKELLDQLPSMPENGLGKARNKVLYISNPTTPLSEEADEDLHLFIRKSPGMIGDLPINKDKPADAA